MNDGRLTIPLYEFENISKPVNPHYPSKIYTKFFKIKLSIRPSIDSWTDNCYYTDRWTFIFRGKEYGVDR